MARRRAPTDLAGRRQDLGLTVDEMASGIGMRRYEVEEIERHEASEERLNHYATWLKRIEAWSPIERTNRFQRAKQGHRFA